VTEPENIRIAESSLQPLYSRIPEGQQNLGKGKKHCAPFPSVSPNSADASPERRSPIIVISFLQDLNRVRYLIGRQVVELVPATKAISKESCRMQRPDPFDQLAGHLD
jgi:hypothetical protein